MTGARKLAAFAEKTVRYLKQAVANLPTARMPRVCTHIIAAGAARRAFALAMAITVTMAAVAQQPAQPRPRASRAANLSRAAAAGDLKQIEFLIESGKDPNTATRGSNLPLFEAIKNNRLEAVKLLVKYKVNLYAYDFEYELTPLQVAAFLGHTEICRFLVSEGVPVKDAQRRRLTKPRGDAPLLLAAKNNHFDTVRYFLDAGANPLVRGQRGEDLLFYAVMHDNAEFIELAFSLGADMRTIPPQSSTPLHNAAKRGRMGQIERLLREPLDIDAGDADGATALHRACEQGLKPIVARLIESGANVNALTQNSETPLVWAIRGLKNDLVALLLDKGADPAIEDLEGFNALHRVLLAKGEDLALLLIDHTPALKDALDPAGRSPMQIATDNGLHDAVTHLIAAGASLHLQGEELGWTPLFEAVLEPGDALVKILLENGARVDARSHASFTPLHVACQAGNVEAVARLLEAGSDPNDQDNLARWSPLHQAAANGDPGLVDLLVEHKAAIDSRDTRQSTPLHVAAWAGNAECLSRLLALGAALDPVDVMRRTPLHVAVLGGHTAIVDILVTASAGVNAEDVSGRTPLDMAFAAGHAEIARLLEQRGAHGDPVATRIETAAHRAVTQGNIKALESLGPDAINAQAPGGETPLHLAVAAGNLAAVELLVNNLRANTGIRDDSGMTPLDMAADAGNAGIVAVLASAPTPANAPGHPAGWTPLHFAAAGGHLDAIKVLLEHGAHSMPDAAGLTPLDLARAAEQDGLVAILAPAS